MIAKKKRAAIKFCGVLVKEAWLQRLWAKAFAVDGAKPVAADHIVLAVVVAPQLSFF
jgi:hypothetical protein